MLIEDKAGLEEAEAVRNAFAEAGFDVEVEARYGSKGVGVETWIVVVPVFSISAFFKAFLDEAAKDAYPALKRLLRNNAAGTPGLRQRRGQLTGPRLSVHHE